ADAHVPDLVLADGLRVPPDEGAVVVAAPVDAGPDPVVAPRDVRRGRPAAGRRRAPHAIAEGLRGQVGAGHVDAGEHRADGRLDHTGVVVRRRLAVGPLVDPEGVHLLEL